MRAKTDLERRGLEGEERSGEKREREREREMRGSRRIQRESEISDNWRESKERGRYQTNCLP